MNLVRCSISIMYQLVRFYAPSPTLPHHRRVLYHTDILQCLKYNILLLIHKPVIFVKSVNPPPPPYLSNTRRHTVHTSVTSTNHDHVLITCICDVNLQISWRKQKINVPPDSTTKLDLFLQNLLKRVENLTLHIFYSLLPIKLFLLVAFQKIHCKLNAF